MNGVLSDTQRHKVAGAQNSPSSNGTSITVIGPKQALRIQISYVKKWLKNPWSPLLLHCLLSPKLHYGLIGSSLESAVREREDSGLVYRWFHMICRHLEVDSCNTTAPFWYILEGYKGREILPGDRTSSTVCGYSLYLEGKISRHTNTWANGQGRRRNMFEKLVTRKSGEEVGR